MSQESITELAKSAKGKEKSQAELRDSLRSKLDSLEPVLDEGIKEYKLNLKEGTFEDQEGEEEGSGEKRKQAMQARLTSIINRAEKIKNKLDNGEELTQVTGDLSATYTHKDGKVETITLDIESKIQDFISFYNTNNIYIPSDFEDAIRGIWNNNQTEIQQAIEQNGFDDMLIIPPTTDLSDPAEKLKMENGNYTGSNFDEGGGFAGAVSTNVDKPRIILYHKKTLPEVQEETGLDVHLNITAGDALKMFEQNPNEHMTLADFIIMERKNFEESGIHISDWNKKSGQWLNTKSGTRLVDSYWNPGYRRLDVNAIDSGDRDDNLGVRPSRCFY